MKNRLSLTVSSYKSSRHYSFHRSIVWLGLLAIAAVFASLAWARFMLVETQQKLSVAEDSQNASQISVSQLQHAQQNLFSTLDVREQQLRALDNRLDQLEVLAGTEQGEYPAGYDERLLNLTSTLSEKQMLLSKIPNGEPMQYRRMSSKYGYRTHPISKRRHHHKGVDLRADKGTPIYATADGYIEQARSNYDRGYGNMVSIRHQMGFNTRYAHLDEVLVKFGQYVRKGELIGYCGNSGDSTASHLHYEVAFLDQVLDPKPFMKLNLTNFDQITATVRTIPWESFQQEIRLLSQQPAPQLSQQGLVSMAPLNSAVTFMSKAK
ncbi:M23 family metallopeptidase [Echinimonas agarilytica]|uniref:M23 family metallopeptidase n=1 Tax=Echinimonas agarilytica TaxID=1215918 RepID=A0AA42B7S2_9GAMM|nr:M23 family metallopeptidase [Echinimonas agarilytica]